jgi:two-component system chemotaxis response regulator CheY
VGQKILIVHDERDLVGGLVRVLVPRGHACPTAYTGCQGIELIDQQHPDVVLTDFYLPDMDGLSVLRHARGHVPPIPGILMTAYTSPPNVNRAYDAGATLYLAKPFSNVALVEAIERILTRS